MHRVRVMRGGLPEVFGIWITKRQRRFKSGKINGQGNESELEIADNSDDVKCNKEAAEVCPVAVIKII